MNTRHHVLTYHATSIMASVSPPAVKAHIVSEPGHPFAEVPLHKRLGMVDVGRPPKQSPDAGPPVQRVSTESCEFALHSIQCTFMRNYDSDTELV